MVGGLIGLGGDDKVNQCKYQGDLIYILEKGGVSETSDGDVGVGGLFGMIYRSDISFCENTSSSINLFITGETSSALSRKKYISGLFGTGQNNTVSCCRNRSNFVINYYKKTMNTTKQMNTKISGIADNDYGKTINCYSVVDSVICIAPQNYTGIKYYGIGPNTKKACFHNSDCIISGTAITSSDASEGAYTSEQMKTKTFLDDLNTYSMLEMDEPVWVQGEDGYPINKYFYSPSAEIDEITVSPTATDINIGETKQLNYSVKPYNATSTVTWKSDNSSIATVSSSGLVKGIAEGKTTIRATTDNGKTASCEVTVKKVEATSISLPSTKTVYIGETVTLTYTMTPSNATNSVTWKSTDTSIATVSSSGVVTGKKEGSTNITVTTDNGKSASCKVYVEPKPIDPTKISLSSCNVEVGYSIKIRYTLEPENATTTITWKSSDTSIATVSSDGIVKGIKQGSAKITATTDNGLSADIWVYIGGFKEGTIFYGTTSEDYDVTYKVTDINANTCAVIRCEKTAKRIVIPSSVQGYKVTSIKQASFSQCEIEEISLPNSLTTIGTQAFSWCKSLKSISIPNSVTSIEEKSFQYCEKLESVVLSNNMKRIEHWLFWECTSLLNVSGYNNIEYIDIGAFNKTPWLANLPDGENYIGKVLLTYKGKMPANTTIKIKDGCTQIAGSAFSNQVGLVAITIPSSLVILDSNPFAGCTNLTSFKVMSKEPIKINEDVFFVETDSIHTFDQTTLCVPKGTKVKYQEADVWKNFKNIVEFDPTGIDDITVDEDGQQTIYSISGIRLKRPQKGLNIINGKKVVVR